MFWFCLILYTVVCVDVLSVEDEKSNLQAGRMFSNIEKFIISNRNNYLIFYFKYKKKINVYFLLNDCPHEEQNSMERSCRVAPHCEQNLSDGPE